MVNDVLGYSIVSSFILHPSSFILHPSSLIPPNIPHPSEHPSSLRKPPPHPAQTLHPSLPHDERVFDAHADTVVGVIEARLDRENVAHFDEVLIRGLQSE